MRKPAPLKDRNIYLCGRTWIHHETTLFQILQVGTEKTIEGTDRALPSHKEVAGCFIPGENTYLPFLLELKNTLPQSRPSCSYCQVDSVSVRLGHYTSHKAGVIEQHAMCRCSDMLLMWKVQFSMNSLLVADDFDAVC